MSFPPLSINCNWVKITIKCLWCPHQNHPVIMNILQNNEILRFYYKLPNIYTHISTMISLLKCVSLILYNFLDWVYVILACPTRCSANINECNKWLNYTKLKYFLYVLIVLNKFFDETSHFDHLYSIFIIILNILTCPWNCCPTCPYVVTAPLWNWLISDITTTMLSFFNGGWNNCCKYSKYLHLYFLIFIILCL